MEEKELQFHTPVLLNEVITGLNIKVNRWYIDATAGGGGHTQGIIEKGGRVIAFDKDLDAISYLTIKFHKELVEGRLKLIHGGFENLEIELAKIGIDKVQGIIFDLGISWHQLKGSGRGFSFIGDEPLDMRMDIKSPLTAEYIINNLSEKDLYELFIKNSEEHLARRIADSVCRARAINPIRTTSELNNLITTIYHEAGIRTKISPATKIFQALRIAVNQELYRLKLVLPQALRKLERGGRLVTISFHSGEDRIIKKFFIHEQIKGLLKIITKRPMTVGKEEGRVNPASRSAKLRVAEIITNVI
jgi:16S rRNA (cytosine1402-N4)-methyltransferase